MTQIGSNAGMVSQSLTATIDAQGNPIISSDNTFGASPAGPALLTQQLFGLANATFNLTPPDVYSALAPDNQVPYWDWIDYSDSSMSATATYDTVAKTWGIIINPGAAINGDYATFTTRSYLVNDDNLGLRQRAFAVISKTGTAAATTQWNITLNAIYYDVNGTVLTTTVVDTELDTATFTSLSGYTTTSGAVVSASARYVDLQFKVAATATNTGTAKVTIKSCLLSSKVGANASFLIVDSFTSSGTWTVPTGVTKVDVIAMGAGGGGGGGGSYKGTSATHSVRGGGGGGGGSFAWFQGVDVSTSTTVSVGIGAGGAGGALATGTATGGNGTSGGATTFGSIVVANGGAGGVGGSSTTGGANTGGGGTGGAGGAVSSATWSPNKYDGKTGGNSAVYTGNGVVVTATTDGGASTLTGFTTVPYYGVLTPSAGSSGGASGGVAGIGGGGGAGGMNANLFTGSPSSAPSNGGAGGGGGGGVAAKSTSGNVTGGTGGAAGSNSAAGGGGGGAAATNGTPTSGAGGAGGSGCFLAVIYTS